MHARNHLIVDLGITLAAFDAHGLPDFVESTESIQLAGLAPVPEEPGRALVYVRRSRLEPREGWVYVGWFEGVTFEPGARLLRYEHFCELEPVPVGIAGDESPSQLEPPRGANYGFVTTAAFERVMREGLARRFKLSERVLGELAVFAAEAGVPEDAVVETALHLYLERHAGASECEARAARLREAN